MALDVPEPARPPTRMLLGLTAGQFTATLSTTVITSALPTIAGEFGEQAHLAWMASATLLAATVAGPIQGKLADTLGRRAVFLTASLAYIIGAVIAGTSSTTAQFVAGLAVEGIGIGGLLVMTQIVLADLTTPRNRGRYIGYVVAGFGLASVSGPLIGGFLVGVPWLGWRLCFFGAVPISVGVYLLVNPRLTGRPEHPPRKIDGAGMALLALSISSFLILVSFAGRDLRWASPVTLLLIAALVISVAALITVERRADDPVLPGRLLRSRPIQLCVAASVLTSGTLYAVLFLVPQFLQVAWGVSPEASGRYLVPFMVVQIVATLAVGRLLSRTGQWKRYFVAGVVLMTCGVTVLALMRAHTDLVLPWALVLIGAGLGMSVQILMVVAVSQAPRADTGTTTSLITFARSLGSTLGVAVIGAVTASRVQSELPRRLRENGLPPDVIASLGTPGDTASLPALVRDSVQDAYEIGFHDAMTVALCFVVLMPLIAWRLRAPALSHASADGPQPGDGCARPT